ncbi:hypothetical protein J2W34_004368 [Variovorax boronicumulans]|uniref:hypothetical protein n=1 Tax=Variovorax boronicumulans TaxID=436515 RepID=UPI00278B5863|nr:hypothetical protein [Variovorax boronicumulans]MDQ0072563.1 hypothetical protein [Variovorax boronicumulans]
MKTEPNLERLPRSLSVFAPLKIVVAYIFITILLHLFGPWTYQNEAMLPMLGFMILVTVLFAAGYWSVAKRWKNLLIKDEEVCAKNFKRFLRVSKWGLVLQSSLIVLAFVSDLVNGDISISALLDPGQIYVNALAAGKEAEVSISLLTQIKTLFSPLFLLSNAVLIFNFQRIERKWRSLLIFAIVLQLLHGVLTKGAQKGVFDAFILLTAVGILKVYLQKYDFIRWRRRGIFLLSLVVVVFIFFQLSRLNAYDALDYSGSSQASLDRDSLLFTLFGDQVGLGISLFISYISQGYYGLSLSLQLPFEWSYGMGNSFALTSYAEQYFGVSNIFEQTYPYRMEYVFNWPAKMYWHTIFPWLASDITFPGALALMFFVGRGYARSLIDGVVYESPLGICAFYLLTTFLLYLPANNQLMQTREMMIATVVVFASWMVFGVRLRKQRHVRLVSQMPAPFTTKRKI